MNDNIHDNRSDDNDSNSNKGHGSRSLYNLSTCLARLESTSLSMKRYCQKSVDNNVNNSNSDDNDSNGIEGKTEL